MTTASNINITVATTPVSPANGYPLQDMKGEPNDQLRPWGVALMVSVAVALTLAEGLAAALVLTRVGTLFPNQECSQVKTESWRAEAVCTGNKRG